MRQQARHADVIFMPYNYLIDPQYRQQLKLNLRNAIILVDEAHNFLPACEDVGSFCIESKNLDSILDGLKVIQDHGGQMKIEDEEIDMIR